MFATMPLRPRAPQTLGHLARTRREATMHRPDHTLQLQALLECLKDICLSMEAHRWADIAPHPSTDRTRDFLVSAVNLVECFPDAPRPGNYVARESEIVSMARAARRVLVDPIPEVAPVLDRIRDTFEDMGEVVR